MGKKKVSPVANLTHKVQDVLKEIVQAPPEPPKQEEETEELAPETSTHAAEQVTEESDQEELEQQSWNEERERKRDMIREEILSKLNHATEQWKETGDVGVHLEPPVPFSEKLKTFLGKVRAGQKTISAKLHGQLTNAMVVQQALAKDIKETINAKLEERRLAKEHAKLIAEQSAPKKQEDAAPLIATQTSHSPPLQTPSRILEPPRPASQVTATQPKPASSQATVEQEWQEVMHKLSPSEREEIEHMLDQLASK